LTLICSSVILRNLTVSNAGSILVDATHFNSPYLVESTQRYITQSLETFLESRMLDDLPLDVIRSLAKFVRAKQGDRSPLARSGVLLDLAMSKNEEWLALQDFPAPILPKERHTAVLSPVLRTKDPKLSPPPLTSMRPESVSSGIGIRPRLSSSKLNVGAVAPDGDELFTMDGLDCGEKDEEKKDIVEKVEPSTPSKGGWKVTSTPRYAMGHQLFIAILFNGFIRVDMKSIMAEAESSQSTSNKDHMRRPGVPLTTSLSASPRASPAHPLPGLSPRPPGAPWRPLTTPTNAPGPLYKPPLVVSPATQTPPVTLVSQVSKTEVERLQQSPGRSGISPRPAIPSQQPHVRTSTTLQRPSMGPVISPSKHMSGKNTNVASVRRRSYSFLSLAVAFAESGCIVCVFLQWE
jgi:inhibitor of Bruton tyrosine kinase